MKKTKYVLLTLIIILFFTNIDIVIESTKLSCNIFFNKVFISIFPFIILSDILIYYDYHIFLKDVFGNFIKRLFNIDKNATLIVILSLLSSHPTNAIFIKDMLDNNQIDIDTASNLLIFTFYPSLAFVLGVLGYKVGLIIYLIVILNNILIGIFLRNKERPNNSKIIIQKEKNIFIVLKNSIIKGINTSLIILGNLIIFMIIVSIINKYLSINPVILSILNGILELTSGIIQINSINIPFIIKISVTLFILLFSGLSVIFQAISILSDYKINIKKILITKLVFSLITTSILWICYMICPINA